MSSAELASTTTLGWEIRSPNQLLTSGSAMLRLDSPIGCSHATYYGAVAHVATNAIVAARDAIAATLPPEQPLQRCEGTSQALGRSWHSEYCNAVSGLAMTAKRPHSSTAYRSGKADLHVAAPSSHRHRRSRPFRPVSRAQGGGISACGAGRRARPRCRARQDGWLGSR